MDIKGYFDPVSLDRPSFQLLPEKYSFSRNISIHTPDQSIKDLEKYQLAIIGLPQDQSGYIRGSADAPDQVRGMLYQLRMSDPKVKICDLGNLKITSRITDTYYAIRDIVLDLHEKKVIPFFIGGSQDLSFGVILALQQLQGIQQVVTIDPRIDFWPDKEKEVNSRNYLNYLIDGDIREKFLYSNIGHQVYFVSQDQVDILENEMMESMRLGAVREDIRVTEPLIRDADFLGIDMNAVRHSDGPGVTNPSPNGLFGDELCAMTRYGGISEKVKVAGLFEIAPGNDFNKQTSHLAAQAIWYFIEGLAHRVNENPLDNPGHSKKFIVTPENAQQELIFHKSTLSERWWLEIPVINPVTNHNYFIACAYEDYQQACNNLIPERWWRYLQRLEN